MEREKKLPNLNKSSVESHDSAVISGWEIIQLKDDDGYYYGLDSIMVPRLQVAVCT